jgi:hypothetical protein
MDTPLISAAVSLLCPSSIQHEPNRIKRDDRSSDIS